MNANIFQAAIYCDDCANAIRTRLGEPADYDPDNEYTWDSGDYPKGPYGEGGGEADSPQHCDACGLFLENPLTPDGVEYVNRLCEPYNFDSPESGELARRLESSGYHIAAEWVRFYGADLESAS